MKGLKSYSLYRLQGTTFVGGAAMLYQYDDDNNNASIVSLENKKMYNLELLLILLSKL